MHDLADIPDMIRRLYDCPAGLDGWKEFENICTDILTFLFVPPLAPPKVQPRTYSEIDRRDVVFPNREDISNSIWARIYRELEARLVLFEFKNYRKEDVGKEEVNQTRNYLNKAMGKLAIIISNKQPVEQAYIKRNTIFSEEGIVILLLTKDKLEEMLYIKERGEDPADLIMDEIEWFYLKHE